MAENKNFFKIDGIVYDKFAKSGKTKDGKDFSIPYLVLEIQAGYKNKEGIYINSTYLQRFRMNNKVTLIADNYAVKDYVTVSFLLCGKGFKRREGGMSYDNEMLVYDIQHSALDAHASRPTGQIKIEPEPIKKETPIVTEEYSDDDLPF